MDQSVLSAFLRRSGPLAKRRARFLFWALTQVRLSPAVPRSSDGREASTEEKDDDDEDDDDGSSGGTKVSVENMCAILQFALTKRAPRFVFVCGANSTLLRSADRGKTYRRISIAGVPASVVDLKSAKVNRGSEGEAGSATEDATTLRDIIRLLPNGATLRDATGCGGEDDDDENADDGDDVAEEGAEAVASAAAAAPQGGSANNDVFSVATYEDFVAVCGANGLVAISADRGVTFVSLPLAALLRASSKAKDRTRTPNVAVSIRGITFGSKTTLLFYSTNSLYAADFTRLSLTQAAFFPVVRHLHDFDSAIGTVVASPGTSSSSSSSKRVPPPECIASTVNMLHFSYDCGVTFLSVRHSLGLVRCLVDLTNVFVRREDVPPFPNSELPAAAAPGNLPLPPKRFSYSTECSLDVKNVKRAAKPPPSLTEGVECNAAVEEALCRSMSEQFAQTCPWSYTAGDGGRYRVFTALSTGGKLVPYDFTSLLYVAIPAGRDKVLVAAANVDYIAFVQSGAADGVGLSVQPGPDDGMYSMVRSTSSGISRSIDLGRTWTSPIHAYMRGCCPLDDGSFIVCNSRKMVAVSEDYGHSFRPVSIPFTTLPTLYDIAVME